MKQKTYSFKKGQQLYLDDIYDIQGLAGGDWWVNPKDDGGDDVLITRNVKIIIKWVVE